MLLKIRKSLLNNSVRLGTIENQAIVPEILLKRFYLKSGNGST